MSKAILFSVPPEQCCNIANGRQTVFVQRRKPKLNTPFKVYIYCTLQGSNEFFQSLKNSLGEYEALSKWNKENWGVKKGKVIGEFVCDTIITDKTFGHDALFNKAACMTDAEVAAYCVNNEMYGLHISNLEIYDCPKALNEFYIVDKDAVKSCEHREQSYHKFTDTGYIKNGFLCKDKFDWCTKCKVKSLTKAPSSYCYVEELK